MPRLKAMATTCRFNPFCHPSQREALVPSSPSILLGDTVFSTMSALLITCQGPVTKHTLLCWQGVFQVHLATCESSREGGHSLNCSESPFLKVLKSSTQTSIIITLGPGPLSSLCAAPRGTCHPGESLVSTLPEAPEPPHQPVFLLQRSPSVNSACVGI